MQRGKLLVLNLWVCNMYDFINIFSKALWTFKRSKAFVLEQRVWYICESVNSQLS